MSIARRKIHKPAGQEIDSFEDSVAQAIFDLENNSAELKQELRELVFVSAREVDVGNGKIAIVIFVPVPLLSQFQRIQVRLVRELEKKFSGRHVLIVAQRRILKRETRRSRAKQPRPRSRTLTAVHDALLEDIAFPTEIVGKRIRYRQDGSKLIKVHLDKKEENNTEHKIGTLTSVYKKLTGKDVVFEFPC